MTLLKKIGHVLTTDIKKDFLTKKNENSTVYLPENFVDILKKRRSVYTLGKKLTYSQSYLTELIQEAVRSCPSILNSQTTRVVILYSNSHHEFWEEVRNIQKEYVSHQIFESVDFRINQCIQAFATVLFYEDLNAVEDLKKQKPFDAQYYDAWIEQVSGMAQFSVWATLADADIGASLQHYNVGVEKMMVENYDIPCSWQLKSQLIFGSIEKAVSAKSHIDYQQQFRVFH